jgi:membrane-associated protein
MLPALLADIQIHGYIALWIIVFLGSAGVPVPCDPLLLAAGALVGHGDLKLIAVVAVAITAAGLGDIAGYLFGRAVGGKALIWLERSAVGRRIVPRRLLERGRSYFARYGGWAIFLSRWLIGVFSGVVNILAGARRFPFRTFFAYALAGEIVDTALLIALGVAFGASWVSANTLLKVISLAAVILLGSALFVIRLVSVRREAKADAQPQRAE